MPIDDYQLLSVDTQEVIADITDAYERIMNTRLHPADPGTLFARWVADYVVALRERLNYAVRRVIPSLAEGEDLDYCAQLYYIQQRPAATFATCKVQFRISAEQTSAILIPAGTRVTDEARTLYWATQADAYIQAGETETELDVVCMTAGTDGNGWEPGTIQTLVDIYDYYTACSNTTRSDGGSDVPDDEEFYNLMRESMDSFTTAGAVGAYIYWGKRASTEIADIIATSPLPGYVFIYAITSDGKPAGQELKEAIAEQCSADTRRPFTDNVRVADPAELEYNIDFTYYTASNSATGSGDIQTAVNEAVDEYIAWQGGKLGRDINPSYLYGLLMQTGIKRVDLKAPLFTVLRDGKKPTDWEQTGKTPEEVDLTEWTPQIAKLGTRNVVNGGYEDE